LIDVLNAVHIGVLSSLHEYKEILRDNSGKAAVDGFVARKRQSDEGRAAMIHALADLGYSQLTHDGVLKQLVSHGLIYRVLDDDEEVSYERPISVMTGVNYIGITAMGRKFLEFIKSPLPEHEVSPASH
jgi:hypothetical protein